MTEPPQVTFRPISRENFMDVVRLSVHEAQRGFVASNVFSIAESTVEPTFVPQAIYAGDVLVGFAMHCHEQPVDRWWILRLMIGAEHQGMGYGNAAMRKLIQEMVDEHGTEAIFLSYDLGNDAAANLYRGLGFRETGEIECGEIVAELRLSGAGEV